MSTEKIKVTINPKSKLVFKLGSKGLKGDGIEFGHIQDTDKYLDFGGENQIHVSEIPKQLINTELTYFVDSTLGNDSNPGTELLPFKTIQHAIDILPKILINTLVIIKLEDGLYPESIGISGFTGGLLYIYGKNSGGGGTGDPDLVLLTDSTEQIVRISSCLGSYIYIGHLSIRTTVDNGICILTEQTTTELSNLKLGDNDNNNTCGIQASLHSTVVFRNIKNLDDKKVSLGLYANVGSIVLIKDLDPTFGDTNIDVEKGSLVTSEKVFIREEDVDAWHIQNTDIQLKSGIVSIDNDNNVSIGTLLGDTATDASKLEIRYQLGNLLSLKKYGWYEGSENSIVFSFADEELGIKITPIKIIGVLKTSIIDGGELQFKVVDIDTNEWHTITISTKGKVYAKAFELSPSSLNTTSYYGFKSEGDIWSIRWRCTDQEHIILRGSGIGGGRYFKIEDSDIDEAKCNIEFATGRMSLGKTTYPTETLDVEGNIIATGYKSSDNRIGITKDVVVKINSGEDYKLLRFKNGLLVECTNAGSLDILTGGVASCDSYESETVLPIYYANDDDESTRWTSSGTPFPHWWKYDLGEGVTKIVTKLRLLPNYFGDTSLKNFKLQGSNNDSDWTDIYTGQHAADGNWEEYTFSNSTPYRYYRLFAIDGWVEQTYFGLWEIEMFE